MGRGSGRRPVRRDDRKTTGSRAYCVCPNCGYRMMHLAGIACNRRTCPKCKERMIRDS